MERRELKETEQDASPAMARMLFSKRRFGAGEAAAVALDFLDHSPKYKKNDSALFATFSEFLPSTAGRNEGGLLSARR